MKKTNYILTLISVSALFVLAYIVITYLFPYISPDSGFYLKIAHDLSEGASFYKDMNVAYTPLGMYLFAGLFKLFPNAGFPLINTFVIGIYILNNILLCKILASFGLDKRLRLLFVSINYLGFYILQGTHILLEQFVLFFQLLSIVWLLKWSTSKWYYLPLAGLACFGAFFSKQYGLFILPAVIFWLFVKSKSFSRFLISGLLWSLGFLFPLLLVYCVFSCIQGISFYELTQQLLGLNVLSGDEVITGINYSFGKFIETLLNFLIKSPITIMLILIVAVKKFRIFNKQSLFFLLLILVGFSQLMFAGYYHYYQLILPYCILFIAYLYQQQANEQKKYFLKFLNIFLVLTILSSCWWLQKDVRFLKEKTKEQAVNKEILNNVLPEGSRVYLEGILPSYYFLCMFDSPEMHKLGYRFPEELTSERISKNMPVGTYIITHPKMNKHKAFADNFKLIEKVNFYKGECLVLQKIKN